MAATAAAMGMDFIPGYGKYLAQLQEDQQADPIAIAVALLAAARQLAPLGRRIGSAMLKRLVGGSTEEFEALVEQVEWKEPAPPEEQDTPTEDSAVSKPEPRKLESELDNIKLTPEQKQQMKRLKVLWNEKQYEKGQPPRHDDNDDHDHQDDHNLFEGVLAIRGLGKRAAYPKGPQQEDTGPDAWQMEIAEKEQLEQNMRTKDAKIKPLEIEMRRMQKEMDELQKLKAQPTPTR